MEPSRKSLAKWFVIMSPQNILSDLLVDFWSGSFSLVWCYWYKAIIFLKSQWLMWKLWNPKRQTRRKWTNLNLLCAFVCVCRGSRMWSSCLSDTGCWFSQSCSSTMASSRSLLMPGLPNRCLSHKILWNPAGKCLKKKSQCLFFPF